jgi:hypothetical protein
MYRSKVVAPGQSGHRVSLGPWSGDRSLLYRLTRRLLSVPAVLLRRDIAKDAELLVLRHENTVLRRQITVQVRYEPADRFWFAALSLLLPHRRWHDIFPVQPATILAWHRRFTAWKWDYSARRGPTGRPPTHSAIKKLVLDLARATTRAGGTEGSRANWSDSDIGSPRRRCGRS